jgi:hypothetical protein
MQMEWRWSGMEWGRSGDGEACGDSLSASIMWQPPVHMSVQPPSRPWGVAALQRRAGIVTSADTPPAGSMAASSGCEAMLPRARAAWLGLGARG